MGFSWRRSFRPRTLGRELHRLDDLLVAGAAAEVSADRVADLAFRRIGIRIEQRLRGDQHSRSAVAALQAVRPAEADLQHAHRAVGPRQAFDGGHAVPVRLHCIHKAGPDRLAVEHHRARAADAVLAADVSAGKAQLLPQPVDEREARRDTRLPALAVHLDRDGVQGIAHRTASARSRASRSARPASTSARWRRYSFVARRALPGSVAFAVSLHASPIASSSDLVPASRAAIFGNARGTAPTPPSPKAARVQRPSASSASCAAAATIAKSPWRTAISVKAEPVRFSPHAGQWISSRHSSGRAAVAIGPAKNFSASRVRAPFDERRTSFAPSTCAASGSSADGSACARLPPTVPRLRVWMWPTHARARRRRGTRE